VQEKKTSMKKITHLFTAVLVALIFCTQVTKAQNNIGVGTAPNASAKLDVSSTTQGMLVPRMTTAQRNAIATPATGLMVFDITLNGFVFYTGSAWAAVGAGVRLELVATKLAATQTLPNANNANLPDVVVFENVVTAPTVGTYINNTYTAGAAGLYMIQTKFSAVQNATPTNTTSGWAFVELNGISPSPNNVYAPYISSGGGASNLPTGFKGVTTSTFLIFLNAGDFIKIKGLNQNSSISNSLNNDGGCQFMVVKMN